MQSFNKEKGAREDSLSFFSKPPSRRSWIKTHPRPAIIIGAMLVSIVILAVVLGAVLGTLAHAYPHISSHRPNNTVLIPSVLQTWWHNTGEINRLSPVQPGNVRQSHLYQVSVSIDGSNFYDSFVYETIPRNGNGNILVPGNLSSVTDQDDSVTIEQDLNMTMAWSSFYLGKDVFLKVHRLDGKPAKANAVVIRPKTLDFPISQAGNDVIIQVPCSSTGSRFSIEFDDIQYSYRLNATTPIAYFVQDQVPSGYGYVQKYTSDMPTVGIEPRDALLIFASPFPDLSLIPLAADAYHVQPGKIPDLSKIQARTVIFGPGVYHSDGTSLANLSTSVNWVHFSPGSYVKSAIWFNSQATDLKATGPGVLSGEEYVYQANTQQGFRNIKSDDHSVRMWSGNIADSQHSTFTLHGPTVNAPPFNSMDFRGYPENLRVFASDYKQVGAFFGQTDGLEAYPGSVMKDIFYHSNDDTIKTYYSNVSISNVIVWKGRTAPIIQFGWASRAISNVHIDNVQIIHSKYNQNDTHPAIIGANQVYTSDISNTSTAILRNWMINVTYSNIHSEGLSPSLLRIVPLQNFYNFTIENVTVEQLLPAGTDMSTSYLPQWYDQYGKSPSLQNVKIKGFKVTGKDVSFGLNDWEVGNVGQMEISEYYAKSGNVSIS